MTVQCTKDAQFIVVVARDATLPNMDLESVSLLGGGQGCTPVGFTSAFAIYQFPVTACGTVMTVGSLFVWVCAIFCLKVAIKTEILLTYCRKSLVL